MNRSTNEPLARVRSSDKQEQALIDHLVNVSELCAHFAAKIGLKHTGRIIGLYHDLGKATREFLYYLLSAVGILKPGDREHVDAERLKGKIDHATAGSQKIWKELKQFGPPGLLSGQVLALCVCSHHTGLIDCLSMEGKDNFIQRMNKPDEKTRLQESIETLSAKAGFPHEGVDWEEVIFELRGRLASLIRSETQADVEQTQHGLCAQCSLAASCCARNPIALFKIGLLTRFLFSCLIDADHSDSADFDERRGKISRGLGQMDWRPLVDKLEAHLAALTPKVSIDELRRDISAHCLARSSDPKGIFTLTVPTGGGKTFSSLRFALNHASRHNMERIIHVVPYTTIIDQNVKVARGILEQEEDPGSIVLEHHSNLTPEQDTELGRKLSENWDAPVIYTTMVQFLESLFGSGTRGARRMHRLSNAVIVFDEIQTLPVRCVHMFCNALNFLVDECGSTAVLCTATQPLLGKLDNPHKGSLSLSSEQEIMPDVSGLFADLKRVELLDRTTPSGWDAGEIVELALEEYRRTGGCLVVVNTKEWAKNLYKIFMGKRVDGLFHLSANQCPAHRMEFLSDMSARLGKKPVLCVSTQLIEAGVDISFGAVVRFAAGFDSILQAGGRCNRHGNDALGRVHVINPDKENIGRLTDIKVGKEQALRIFDEFRRSPEHLGNDLFAPAVVERYFQYYFFQRKNEMDYPVGRGGDNLLNMLSCNRKNPGNMSFSPALRHSFKTSAKFFEVIGTSTEGVIVHHGEGTEIINRLCAAKDPAELRVLARRAQRYTVNMFPNVLKKLEDALHPIGDTGLRYLDFRYYSPEFGLSMEPVRPMETLIC